MNIKKNSETKFLSLAIQTMISTEKINENKKINVKEERKLLRKNTDITLKIDTRNEVIDNTKNTKVLFLINKI